MPTGVAGIRGTAFLLGVNGDVTVLEGSVVISSIGVNGTVFTTVLAAGDQFNPQTGQVTHVNPTELVAAIFNAKAIVVAVNAIVTVVETPSAKGPDTTTLRVSPTSGSSAVFVFGSH
jgi:hypothetical protein